MTATLITVDSPHAAGHKAHLLDTMPSPSRATELSHLIGEIYQGVPQDARNMLLEYLMRPLGVLGLLTVANGIFFKCFLDHGLSSSFFLQVQTHIEVSDVVALAERVQQVNMDVIAAAVNLFSAWPAPMD